MNSLSKSERMAVAAKGPINMYTKSEYIPRNKWDKIEFDNFEKIS